MYRSIQASRGFAALLVVLFHLGGMIALKKYFNAHEFDVLFSAGDAGVEFFFVLSGFIIYTAHRADIGVPERLGVFLKKRFARIFPAYWIVFAAAFTVAIASPSLRGSVPHDPVVLLKSLLLLPQDPLTVGGTGAPVLFVAWTLQYEMFFYALFALLILSRMAAAIVAVGLGAAYIGCAAASTCVLFPLSFLVKDYVLLFAFGMVIARLHDRIIIKRPLVLAGLGLLLFVVISADKVLHFDALADWKIILFGLASSMMVCGLVSAEKSGHIVGNAQFLQLLGEASFALYLIHVPVISLCLKTFVFLQFDSMGFLGALVAYALTLAACVCAAIAFHTGIERPIATRLRPWTQGKSLQAHHA